MHGDAPLARHRRPRARSGTTCATLLAPARRRRALGGRQGRRLRARRASTSGGPRSRPARRRSASRRSARRSSCGRRSPRPGSSSSARSPPVELPAARAARLELCVSAGDAPDGVPVHLKLDTGMGRWGLAELAPPGSGRRRADEPLRLGRLRPVVHREQLARFLAATAPLRAPHPPHREQRRHAALPAAHLDAVRCGIALYGISPFGTDPAADGLRPALRWESDGRAREDARSRARARATADASSPRSRRGSASSRSATRTAFGAT